MHRTSSWLPELTWLPELVACLRRAGTRRPWVGHSVPRRKPQKPLVLLVGACSLLRKQLRAGPTRRWPLRPCKSHLESALLVYQAMRCWYVAVLQLACASLALTCCELWSTASCPFTYCDCRLLRPTKTQEAEKKKKNLFFESISPIMPGQVVDPFPPKPQARSGVEASLLKKTQKRLLSCR